MVHKLAVLGKWIHKINNTVFSITNYIDIFGQYKKLYYFDCSLNMFY